MDKNVKQILRKLDQVERKLQACERRLHEIGNTSTTCYFGVPLQAREHFAGLHDAIDQMRWQLGVDTLPPEG